MTKRKTTKITGKRLLEVFQYERETGRLFWKKPTGNRAKIGAEAGNLCRFHGNEYRQVRIQNENFLTHRLIWFIEKGGWPENQIDHIDGDGLNNRIQNLRDISIQEQAKNLSRRKTNTSGITGVTWNKNLRQWVAQISADKKAIYLGKFDSFDDAVNARKNAEKKLGFHSNHDREKNFF